MLTGSVRIHHPNLRLSSSFGGIDDVGPIGRPGWVFISALIGGKLRGLPGSYIHHEYVVIAGLKALSPSKRDMCSVGIPGRIRRFSRACTDALDIRSFQCHVVNL